MRTSIWRRIARLFKRNPRKNVAPIDHGKPTQLSRETARRIMALEIQKATVE